MLRSALIGHLLLHLLAASDSWPASPILNPENLDYTKLALQLHLLGPSDFQPILISESFEETKLYLQRGIDQGRDSPIVKHYS
jgi:hypothetical protein